MQLVVDNLFANIIPLQEVSKPSNKPVLTTYYIRALGISGRMVWIFQILASDTNKDNNAYSSLQECKITKTTNLVRI